MNRKHQSYIVSLIENDVVSNKLISTLADIGVDASCYESCSADVVRYLMDIEIEERYVDNWNRKYYNLLQKGKNIDVSTDRTIVRRLAIEIFLSLKPL